MSGSSFGKLFRITTWGESHGAGIGVVIDGCPAGLSLSEDVIQVFLDRRRPGQSKYTTKRSESDTERFSPVFFEGENNRYPHFSPGTQSGSAIPGLRQYCPYLPPGACRLRIF